MKLIGEITDEKIQESLAQYILDLAQDSIKRANRASKMNAEANQKADEAVALRLANAERKEAERSAAIKEGEEADAAAALRLANAKRKEAERSAAEEAIKKVEVLDTELLATMLRIVQKGGSLRKEDKPYLLELAS